MTNFSRSSFKIAQRIVPTNETMRQSEDHLLRMDEQDDEKFQTRSEQRRPRRSCIPLYTKVSLGLLVISLLAGVIAAILTGNFNPPIPVEQDKWHCGSSAAEARSLGCKFDVMEFGWVHPECWDQELLDKYAPPDRWAYSWDRYLQEPISQSQASTGFLDALWVRNDYHGAHCIYVFEKMARAVAQGKPVNRRKRQMVHTHHCSKSIHEIEPGNFNVTGLGGVNYMSCDADYLL